MNKKHTIVLVAGGTCSGKSVFATWFHHAILVSMDNFYVPKAQLKKKKDGTYDVDAPHAVDVALCADAVVSLAEGKTTEIPTYNYRLYDRTGTKRVKPQADTQFIVVEGLFALHSPLREIGDMKIFLDTPMELRLARRMIRDITRHRRSKEETLSMFEPIEKNYKLYVEPTKAFADLVVPFSYNPMEFLG